MITQELLDEAKRRYPPGTTYYNLNMVGERSDSKEGPITAPEYDKAYFYDVGSRVSDIVCLKNGYGWVHANGIWAEIVSIPEVDNYQIY